MFKRILIFILALVMCMGGTVNVLAAANNDLKVEVNGKVVEAP